MAVAAHAVERGIPHPDGSDFDANETLFNLHAAGHADGAYDNATWHVIVGHRRRRLVYHDRPQALTTLSTP
jgi:hypothetical protein